MVEFELIIDEYVTKVDETIFSFEYLKDFNLPIPEKNLYEFKYWYYISNDEEIILTNSSGNSIAPLDIKGQVKVYPEFEYLITGPITNVQFEYDETEDGYYIIGFDAGGHILFPDTYENKPVIGIKRNSYKGYLYYASTIRSIIFPASFKYIEGDFIHYSPKAECSIYIYFENPDSIIDIGYSQNVTSLNTVYIGKNCRNISKMFVKNGNITISKDNPFLTIEDNVLYSADFKTLFYVYTSEQVFHVNNLVEKISGNAFIKCINLTELHLSNSLKEVEKWSFYINGGGITKYYFYNTNTIEICGDEKTLSFASNAPITFYVPSLDYNPFEFISADIEINPYLE